MTGLPPAEAGTIRLSRVAATLSGDAAATRLVRLSEAGQLRLRRLRGAACELVVVNTAGGIVGGDKLTLEIGVEGAGAAVAVGTAAAEKCYRTDGAISSVATRLRVEDGASLLWLPQECILFDGARFERSLHVELDASAVFVGAETTVFGRLAHGEVMQRGAFRDSWRVRRAGRLVFADETRLDAPIATTLDRAATGGGARAAALLVVAAPGAERCLTPLRAALDLLAAGDAPLESGASLRDGLLVARLVSRSPRRLRDCVAAAIGVVRAGPLPRSWT